jgi:hypothetical protein
LYFDVGVNIRKDIIERSDGIPLFVEEMTKAVRLPECFSLFDQQTCPLCGRLEFRR